MFPSSSFSLSLPSKDILQRLLSGWHRVASTEKGVSWRRASWKHHRWYNWSLCEPATGELLLDWGRSSSSSWCLTISCFCMAPNGTRARNCYFCAVSFLLHNVSDTPCFPQAPAAHQRVGATECMAYIMFFFPSSYVLRVLTCIPSVPADRCFPCQLARAICLSHPRGKQNYFVVNEAQLSETGELFLFARPSCLCEMPCLLQLCIYSP